MRERRPLTAPIRTDADFERELGVSRETVALLEIYSGLLRRWQKAVNLVAPRTLPEIWHRHFADCAQIVPLAPHRGHWVDLGSGAGLPGLIVGIMLRDALLSREVRLTLVESDQRKSAFLREAARHLGLPVDILSARIEDCATHDNVLQADVVSARALAPLARLLALAAPLSTPGATMVFLKGRTVGEELAEASLGWRFRSRLVQSITDPEGRIVVLTGVQAITKGS
jgi:16S rRNA (guanine527-N7)-methyltransferase